LSKELRILSEEYIRDQNSPGLSVAVVRDGVVLLSGGIGVANLESEEGATNKTVYKIGSITKQFTAAAILKLVADGKLALDDAVTKHLEGAPDDWKNVTIQHLLNHTSGIPNYTSAESFSKVDRLDLSHDQVLDIIKAEPMVLQPGESWDYSNSNYYILGMIIEFISGKNYDEYLSDTFFRPLGMNSTVYCSHSKIINHRASGYEKTAEHWINAAFISMNPAFSAGGLCSTAEDLATWSEALLGGKVISFEQYRQMTTPEDLADGTPLSYGFGVMTEELLGVKRVVHNGGIPGFSAFVSRYDKYNLHIVVLTNAGDGAPDKLEADLAKAILDGNDL
jgi:CubicO group peptidase (beta-lactamase class C family)